MPGPFLDVATETLTDPMIADSFTVTRRPEVVSTHGRSTVPAPVVTNGVLGVVTSASSNDLERLDDNDRMGRHLSIVTKFALQGPTKNGATNYKPDLITYHGDVYVVQYIDPYWQFGGVGGFVQAIVGSIDHLDAPP